MKRNVLVLALLMSSVGAFAQNFKDKAKELQNVKTEVVQESAESKGRTVMVDNATEVTATKTKNLTIKAAKGTVVNAGTAVVEAVTEEVEVMIEEVATEKVDDLKEAAEATIEEVQTIEEEVLVNATEAHKTTETDITKLSAEVAGKEALKEDKKTALLTKITALGAKVTAAESKLEVLKKSGLAPEALIEKTAIIDSAKTKLAALTASYS
jgi:hypothetical protein